MLKIIKGELEAIQKEMDDLKNVHHAEMLKRWQDIVKSYKADLKNTKEKLREIKVDLRFLAKDPRDPRFHEWKEKELNLEQKINEIKKAIAIQESVIANHKIFYSASFYRKLPVWVNAPQSSYEPILMDWNLLEKISKLLKRCRVELEIIRPPKNLLVIHYYTGYSKGRFELYGLAGEYENFKKIPCSEPIEC